MARNVIELVLQVRDQSRAALSAATQQVRQFAATTQQTLAGIGRQAANVWAPLVGGRLANTLATLKTNVGSVGAVFGSVRTSINRFGQAITHTIDRITNFNAIVRVAAVLGLARATTGAADAMLTINTRLKLVTESTKQLNDVQEELFRLSQATRTSFTSTVDLYARVARSSSQLGASQDQLLKFTQAVSQSIQVSGSTTKEAAAGVIQFGQALASSRLSGDELRSVLEQMPRLARAIADGLGVTIGRLREMGQAGQLTAPEVFKALLSQSDKINEEFKNVNVTIGQQVQVVGNSLQRLVGNVLNTSGATGGLIEALRNLSTTLEDPRTADGLRSLVEGLAGVASVASRALGALGDFYNFLDDRLQRKNAGTLNELYQQFDRLSRLKKLGFEIDEDEIKAAEKRMQEFARNFLPNGLTADGRPASAPFSGQGGPRTRVFGSNEQDFARSFNREGVSKALDASFFGDEKTRENIRQNIKALQEFRQVFAGASDDVLKRSGTTREEFNAAGAALGRMQAELLRLDVSKVFDKGIQAVSAVTTEFEKQKTEVAQQVVEVTAYINKLRSLSAAQIETFREAGELGAGGLAEAERALERLQALSIQLKLGDKFEEARDSVKAFVGDIEQQRFTLSKSSQELADYVLKLKALTDAERAALVREEIIDANELERASQALERLNLELRKLPVSTAARAAGDAMKALRSDVQVVADEVAEQQVALAEYLRELIKFPEDNAEAIRTVMTAQQEAARQGQERLLEAERGILSLEAQARRSAESIHDAFVEAFSSVFKFESPRDILRNFLIAIREVPIQIAATEFGNKIRESLKLDEYFKKVLGVTEKRAPAGAAAAILTGKVAGGEETRTAAQIRAAEIVEKIKADATVPRAIEEAASKTAEATANSAQAMCDCVCDCLGSLRSVVAGGPKDVVTGVDNSVQTAAATINNTAIDVGNRVVDAIYGSARSSKNSDLLFDLGKSLFSIGAAAGGGRQSGLTLLGEEGPELALLPAGSQIMNRRQAMFAGGQGPKVELHETHHITIQGGAGDDIERKLQEFFMVRDAKLERRIYDRLQANGFRRLT